MKKEKLIGDLLDKYTPSNVMRHSCIEFCQELIRDGFVLNESDFNLLALEAIQRAFADDDEFPIHYYSKDEPMSETGRCVEDVVCLTDDYIANVLNES